MSQLEVVTAAADRAMKWLSVQQRADGSFVTEVGALGDEANATPVSCGEQTTTFVTAMVLEALNVVSGKLNVDEGLARVRQLAAEWLLTQRSERWTFNYWPRRSREAMERPYPEDWDDTACALVALQHYDASWVGPEAVAAVVRNLTASERAVGGPYVTWMVSGDKEGTWRDVDAGVNCNIGYWLSEQGVRLPHVDAVIEAAAVQGTYRTPYYDVTDYAVLYFAARYYSGPAVGLMVDRLLRGRGQDGSWGTSLETALALSALMRWGGPQEVVAQGVNWLLRQEYGKGGWRDGWLYVERREGRRTDVAGGAALTTALVMEVLALYGEMVEVKEQSGPEKGLLGEVAMKAAQEARAIGEAVEQGVRERLMRLPEALRREALLALKRQLARDADGQVRLLPLVWERALRPSLQWAGRDRLIELGTVNLYGWMAYTIYDDFWDEEGALPALGVANVALREVSYRLKGIGTGIPGLERLVERVLDGVDAANTWEVTTTRMRREEAHWALAATPDYGARVRLAGRSMGHALGPLTLLLIRGHAVDSLEVQKTEEFFEHYLTLRQLNDDVHDWAEDMAVGRINMVGAWLLRREGTVQVKATDAELAELIRGLGIRLWRSEIETVCAWIFEEAREARAALQANPVVRDKAALERWIRPLEAAAEEALREREQTLAFLEAYKKADAAPDERGRREGQD